MIDALREALLIDPEWSTSGSQDLTWWPHRLEQRLEERDGLLSVETDALAFDGEPGVEVLSRLASLMRFPALSGLVLEAGRVSLRSAIRIEPEVARVLVPLAAVSAAVQASYAEMGVASLVELTGGRAPFSAHPQSGARPQADDMLHLLTHEILPAGEALSRWEPPAERLQAVEALMDDGFTAEATPEGLSARFPGEGGISLLQVRQREKHPELGSGVFVRLYLPVPASSPLSTPRTALWLNGREGEEGPAQFSLGSFCLEQSEPEIETFSVRPGPPRLAHVTFVPNYVFTRGLLAELCRDAGERAEWALHSLSHADPLV